MIETTQFGEQLRASGFRSSSGVPCSLLGGLFSYAINETHHLGAANEGDAVAICAGAWLGGMKAMVLMQNSGLGNAVSPLTSLIAACRIPVLGFVGWRGEPGRTDEPQHELMGMITPRLLELMKLRFEVLSADQNEAAAQLARAAVTVEGEESFFFLVRKGTFSPMPLQTRISKSRRPMEQPLSARRTVGSRAAVLACLNGQTLPGCAIVATTGYTGRQLQEIADGAGNFYMTGSMGCASSIALGVALAAPTRAVVCLDGDGAALMRLGACATVAEHAPGNLLHVLLDNGCHESTGGQATASEAVDWAGLAQALGYPAVHSVSSLAELSDAAADWQRRPRLTFLHVPIQAGVTRSLSRPPLSPADMARRFQQFLTAAPEGAQPDAAQGAAMRISP